MTERALLALAEAILALADSLSAEIPKAKKGRKTPPPEDLSLEDKKALKAWALEKEKWAVPHLRELVDEMLRYHRAEGKGRVDWYATAQNWITGARTKFGADLKTKQPPAQRMKVDKTEAEIRAEIEASGDRVVPPEEAQERLATIVRMLDRTTERMRMKA